MVICRGHELISGGVFFSLFSLGFQALFLLRNTISFREHFTSSNFNPDILLALHSFIKKIKSVNSGDPFNSSHGIRWGFIFSWESIEFSLFFFLFFSVRNFTLDVSCDKVVINFFFSLVCFAYNFFSLSCYSSWLKIDINSCPIICMLVQ